MLIKKGVYSIEKVIFYQTGNKLILFAWNLLKTEYLRRLLLNQVKYGQRKTSISQKTCNSYLNLMCHSYFFLNMWQVTIQKNLDPVYTWLNTVDFNFRYWDGGNGGGDELLSKFYLFIFFVEEKLIKSNKNPKKFSPNLNRKLPNKVVCLLRYWR